MRARLVWTAVALLVALAAHVRGDCCYTSWVETWIDCPNPYYMSDQCTGDSIWVRTDHKPRWIDCRERTYKEYVGGRGTYVKRCADGSKPTWGDRCTDLSRPVKGKDHEGYFGRCNAAGCDCGWECIAGPVKNDNVIDLCSTLTPLS
jgi:hypothetical protein